MAFVTGSVYDNYWVSHHIPRSDFQYSWITASISASNPYPEGLQTFGHARADGLVQTRHATATVTALSLIHI